MHSITITASGLLSFLSLLSHMLSGSSTQLTQSQWKTFLLKELSCSAVFHRIWSVNWFLHHTWGAWEKCRLSGPTPDLLNQHICLTGSLTSLYACEKFDSMWEHSTLVTKQFLPDQDFHHIRCDFGQIPLPLWASIYQEKGHTPSIDKNECIALLCLWELKESSVNDTKNNLIGDFLHSNECPALSIMVYFPIENEEKTFPIKMRKKSFCVQSKS